MTMHTYKRVLSRNPAVLVEVKSVILCGIEGHACVQQTVFDLVEQNYDVHVITDAVSSRNMVDRYESYCCWLGTKYLHLS